RRPAVLRSDPVRRRAGARAVTDADFLRRALQQAERGRGVTSPNPLVGAVIVRDGRIVGEGAHLRAGGPHAEIEALAAAGDATRGAAAAGGPHAEIEALAAAGDATRGATLYVTLEPCNHHGRTPPCAPAVVRAGITRVVVALRDPNLNVRGGVVDLRRHAGVDVEVGRLAAEAERQNRAWLTAMRERRPHVTLKAAATL